ncbi:MAG: hypothetical protein COA78_02835 [Blastopirellula sp.]|nr:MAG: hypothetical protein COA78_02835 [Blastopirellula sp.]
MNRLRYNKLTGIIVVLILVSLYFGQSILPEIDPNRSPRAAGVPLSSQVFIDPYDSFHHTVVIDGNKIELTLFEASYNYDLELLLIIIQTEKPFGVLLEVDNPKSMLLLNTGSEIVLPDNWKNEPEKMIMSEKTYSKAQAIRFKVKASQLQGNDFRLEWQNPDGTPAEYPPIPFQGIGQMRDSLRYDSTYIEFPE